MLWSAFRVLEPLKYLSNEVTVKNKTIGFNRLWLKVGGAATCHVFTELFVSPKCTPY